MDVSRKEAAWILLICIGGVFVKVLLLLTSQAAVDSDEAILGLMALHIKQGISHPLFFYGQSYDAGSGVLAHVAAFAFAIGGVSGTSLKVMGLVVWLAMAMLAGNILRTWLGWRAAGFGVALILWAPTSVEWGVKARGGYMLAVIFTLLTLALALSSRNTDVGRRRKYANMLAIGASAAAAVWAQPTSLPLVGLVSLWVVCESIRERDYVLPAVLVAGAVTVSIIPIVVLTTAANSWAWQAIAGADTHRNPVVLFGSVLPALFTPELDRSYPPMPIWVRTAGYVWLITVAALCALTIRAQLRGIIPNHLRRPAALLLASMGVAPLAFFMVASDYARPRHILTFYPVACILVSAVVELLRERTSQAWPVLFPVTLLLFGFAVHMDNLGPATIHGAGEQEWRQPAVLIDEITADLNRHRVQCVFSESPMLQWNLIFASQEHIAARWKTPQDRWQPYVDRVNRSFANGERCAVLIANAPGTDSIARLRAHFGEESDRVTVFNERYALLYEIPSNITQFFK